MQADDNRYIAATLRLAAKGSGWTSPNPLVGAILVKNGKIIGQGYHAKFGAPHAEVEALKRAETSPKGATLYVNLEPCAHHGKTPPCTESIIEAGITRVVCASLDPNKLVHGKGVRRLRQAGVAVEVGIQSDASKVLNEAFFIYHEQKRPFVALKFAASLDGKLATTTHDSKWITNESARTYARTLRAKYQAILVGVNTVLNDNPHLGSRVAKAHDPMRIVLDSRLRTPLDAQIIRDQNALIVTSGQASASKLKSFRQKGIDVLQFEDRNQIPISGLLSALYDRQIISVLVEGGGDVLGSFIDNRTIDKVYAFYAPILIGGNGATSIGGKGAAKVSDALRLVAVKTKRYGDNIVLSGYLR